MTHNVTRHKAAPAAPRALTRVNRSTSLRPRIAVGAVLATLAAGGVVGLASHKTVTLDVDDSDTDHEPSPNMVMPAFECIDKGDHRRIARLAVSAGA